MSTFDIIALTVIGMLTIIGLWKGMVRQIFGLLGIIGGYMFAVKFYQQCSNFLTDIHPNTAKAVSFIAIFLVCILVAHLIGWGVGRLFAVAKLGFLNRAGGGLLGFLKGWVIVSIAVMVLTVFISVDHSLFKKSSTIKYILPVTTVLKEITRGDIKNKYNEKVGTDRPGQRKQQR
jgi:membrane protein required for colicin V production